MTILHTNKSTSLVNHVSSSSTIRDLSGNIACFFVIGKNTTWIIDSGATDHMVCSPSLLTESSSVKNCTIQLPNGTRAIVTHVGSVTFSPYLILTNVLCVPSFHLNLISINKLVYNSHYLATFTHNAYVIQDQHSRKMIGMGTERGGMYYLDA